MDVKNERLIFVSIRDKFSTNYIENKSCVISLIMGLLCVAAYTVIAVFFMKPRQKV